MKCDVSLWQQACSSQPVLSVAILLWWWTLVRWSKLFTTAAPSNSKIMKSGVSRARNSTILWSLCAGALSCWNVYKKQNCLLRKISVQQNVAIILSIDFHSGVLKVCASVPENWHANRNHQRLAENWPRSQKACFHNTFHDITVTSRLAKNI